MAVNVVGDKYVIGPSEEDNPQVTRTRIPKPQVVEARYGPGPFIDRPVATDGRYDLFDYSEYAKARGDLERQLWADEEKDFEDRDMFGAMSRAGSMTSAERSAQDAWEQYLQPGQYVAVNRRGKPVFAIRHPQTKALVFGSKLPIYYDDQNRPIDLEHVNYDNWAVAESPEANSTSFEDEQIMRQAIQNMKARKTK